MKGSKHACHPSSSAMSNVPTIDTILILEKVVQEHEQKWIENLNIIEHLIVNIIENHLNLNNSANSGSLSKNVRNDSIWKCNFVVRRLPTYLASCSNTNEYAIVLENFNFTLDKSSINTTTTTGGNHFGRNSSSTSTSSHAHVLKIKNKPNSRLNQNLGQTEIFSTCDAAGDFSNFISYETNSFCSSEIFKEFGLVFLESFHKELANSHRKRGESTNLSPSNKVQLIGAQLLINLKQNKNVDKIFKLTQSLSPPISKSRTSKCTIDIDHLKSIITISLDETRVILRPALFNYQSPRGKLNKQIVDRLPLHHPLLLHLAQSLTKGQLLFPTNYDLIWSFGFWPSEAHILTYFHPSSIPARILRLFTLYCLQPSSFLEFVSIKRNSLLAIHDDEDGSKSETDEDEDGDKIHMSSLDSFANVNSATSSSSQLSVDFLVHAFLTELEAFPNIEHWAPSSFPSRLTRLLSTTIDSIEKSFYPNYFTKTNLLKAYKVKSSVENLNVTSEHFGNNIQEFIDDNEFGDSDEVDGRRRRGRGNRMHGESAGVKIHDDEDEEDEDTFTLGEIDLTHYAEIQEDEVDSRSNRNSTTGYGIRFEELRLNDEEHQEPPEPGTSSPGTNVVNPFSTFDTTTTTATPGSSSQKRETKEGSGSFARILRSLSSSFATKRNSSNTDETELVHPGSKIIADSSTTATDNALSGFEQSVNEMRRQQTINHVLPPSEHSSHERRSQMVSISSYVNEGLDSSIHDANDETSHRHSSIMDRSGTKESIFRMIIERLTSNELFYSIISPSSDEEEDEGELDDSQLSRHEMIVHLEQARKVIYSQDELIGSWQKVVGELIRPKYICPHTFSPRQLQYIGLLVSWIIKSSFPKHQQNDSSSSASANNNTNWEISGDILRTVLYQMRSESNAMLLKKDRKSQGNNGKLMKKAFSFKSKSFNEESSKSQPAAGSSSNNNAGAGAGSSKSQSVLAKTFSLYQHNRGSYDICKVHHHHLLDSPESSVVNDDFETNTFGMDNPELATTHRLLQWLWQLRNSKVGRLSSRAQQYLETLHESSLINSFFLEQWSSANITQSLALESAIAVTKIIASEKYPPSVPLVEAWRRHWSWAEMILSLVSWNSEKGIQLKAAIPILASKQNGESDHKFLDIQMIYPCESANNNNNNGGTCSSGSSSKENSSTKTPTPTPNSTLLKQLHSMEPDDNAITLAFHSETATPIGWNDFEDPRRPGPHAIPILIFSSTSYYNQWEVIGGNIIQVMARLLKFNSLQQIGTLLSQPHKKTALNEIRKMTKSVSYRSFQFDGNVMTKTFRRLASLRNTHRLFSKTNSSRRRRDAEQQRTSPEYFSCERAGCGTSAHTNYTTSVVGKTIVIRHNCTEIECTKL